MMLGPRAVLGTGETVRSCSLRLPQREIALPPRPGPRGASLGTPPLPPNRPKHSCSWTTPFGPAHQWGEMARQNMTPRRTTLSDQPCLGRDNGSSFGRGRGPGGPMLPLFCFCVCARHQRTVASQPGADSSVYRVYSTAELLLLGCGRLRCGSRFGMCAAG